MQYTQLSYISNLFLSMQFRHLSIITTIYIIVNPHQFTLRYILFTTGVCKFTLRYNQLHRLNQTIFYGTIASLGEIWHFLWCDGIFGWCDWSMGEICNKYGAIGLWCMVQTVYGVWCNRFMVYGANRYNLRCKHQCSVVQTGYGYGANRLQVGSKQFMG